VSFDGRELPDTPALGGWLEAHGRKLRIFSAEKTPSVVVLVRDRKARRRLGQIDRLLRQQGVEPPAVLDRPRAVLWVLGDAPEDESHYTLQSIRGFLAALRVPAFLWAPKPQSLEGFEPGPREGIFFGAPGMTAALREMEASLEAQHVLWVEGDFLPQEIELAPGAPAWVSLVE